MISPQVPPADPGPTAAIGSANICDELQQEPLHSRALSLSALGKSLSHVALFLMETEVHVYAFAVAANILMSFFPFLVAMVMLCRSVLHWSAAVQVILLTLHDYFPVGFGVDFRSYLLTSASHPFNWLSLALLLFTANGIFVPLEVAFNRIWRVETNRSFLRNQIVSLALIFGCGVLVLANVSFTTVNAQFLRVNFGANYFSSQFQSLTLRIAALPLTMAMIFLVYWALPNCKIPAKRLIPSSIAVAVLLEILKYINVLTWPMLSAKLQHEVPPFVQSISIILWSFAATLLILAGAEWAALATRLQASGRVSVDSLAPAESQPHA